MADDILVSALTRELSAATNRLISVLRSEGYDGVTLPDGTTKRFPYPFPLFGRDDDIPPKETRWIRESITRQLARVEEGRRAAIGRFNERAAALHGAAAHYDRVKAKLDEAQAAAAPAPQEVANA